MSEFRQNLATKEWVIFDTDRGDKPEDFRAPDERPSRAPKEDCPFCPGKEKTAGEPTFVIGSEASWSVRCFNRRRPVLVSGAAKVPTHGLYRSLPGEGIHEVIVETPDHDAGLADLPEDQVQDVFAAYQERFRAALENPRVALSLLFKNHGPGSGTAVPHSHAQLVGSSVVPSNIRHRMDEAMKYYDSTGSCVFCRMIEAESKDGSRIVEENDLFVAFVLYAALSPFHIWILPKRHVASFGDSNPKEMAALARITQRCLKRLKASLNDPAYNFVIQSTPLDRGTTDCFHWYMSLVVRVSKVTGFELGSGIFTNTVLPEEAAAFLKSAKI